MLWVARKCSAREVLPDPSTVARPRAVLFTTTHGELACVGGETLSLSTRVAACLHGVSLLPCISISLVWSFSQQLWAASTGSWRVWVGNTFLANEGYSARPRVSLISDAFGSDGIALDRLCCRGHQGGYCTFASLFLFLPLPSSSGRIDVLFQRAWSCILLSWFLHERTVWLLALDVCCGFVFHYDGGRRFSTSGALHRVKRFLGGCGRRI